MPETNKPMVLTSLEIELQSWGEFKGQYTGKVAYEGQEGKVQLTLNPEVSRVVLAAIGKTIVQLTQKTAENLTSIVEQSVQQARMAEAAIVPALVVSDM